jgi:hypothetical protein
VGARERGSEGAREKSEGKEREASNSGSEVRQRQVITRLRRRLGARQGGK